MGKAQRVGSVALILGSNNGMAHLVARQQGIGVDMLSTGITV